MDPDIIDRPRRRSRTAALLPSDAALRRIMLDEPETTTKELAEYYDVSEGIVRKTLARLNIKAHKAPPPRKLPTDDLLKPMLVEAEFTGFAPLIAAYGVSGACLSKAKKRLGIEWSAKSLPSRRKRKLRRPVAPSISTAPVSRRPEQLLMAFM